MQLESLDVPLNLVKKGFDVGIAGAVAGVAALAGAVAGMVKLTFDWANELDGLGDVIGGTTEEVASLAFVARKSGVGVEAFTKANVALEKNLVKVDGTLEAAGKSLKGYGIDVKDANGNVKSQVTLTDEIAKKYASLATQQEKVNFLTEVYGKQGASLIDFFDTLNGEGGISAVEEKVRRLGLAIDPTRYEQFNRNLEELKLIGTGIAVSFTEKLMPSLEKGLELITKFAEADPSEKLRMVGDGFNGVITSLENIDWGSLSEKLIEKIGSINWTEVGSSVSEGASRVWDLIKTTANEIDWAGISSSIGTAFSELVLGLIGQPDWASFANSFNNNLNQAFDKARNYSMKDFQSDWAEFVDGLKAAWQGFLNFLEATKEQAQMTGRNVQGGWTDQPTSPSRGRRASGGAVIAGQTYDVAEFSKPEKFTPTQSGRIDTVSDAPAFDEDKMGRAVSKYLARDLPALIMMAKA